MNHTRLSCQHRAVLARRSWLQDAWVSLLSATAPASGPGHGGLPGQLRGVVAWRRDLHVQHLLIQWRCFSCKGSPTN